MTADADYAFQASRWLEGSRCLPMGNGWMNETAFTMQAIEFVNNTRAEADAEVRRRRDKKK